jgi:hypothetical protein
MYSAGAGESALDSLPGADNDPNSVYTRALLPLLKTPGLTLSEVAEQVRENVNKLAVAVKHQQTPAFYNQVVGRACLAGCDVAAAKAQSQTYNMSSLMEACVREPVHPTNVDIATRLAKEIMHAPRYYGWYKEDGTTRVPQKVRSAALVDGGLKITYDWQHGYLLLKVVTPISVATRGIATRSNPNPKYGTWLQGIWVQDNGYGCVDFQISPTIEGSGKIGIRTRDLDAAVFLRPEP